MRLSPSFYCEVLKSIQSGGQKERKKEERNIYGFRSQPFDERKTTTTAEFKRRGIKAASPLIRRQEGLYWPQEMTEI